MSNTTSAVAVTKLTDQQREIKQLIDEGFSIGKDLAKVAPKGFISLCRRERQAMLNGNTSRILGEAQQRGFLVHRSMAVVTKKNGDESWAVEFRKYAERGITKEAALAALGLTAEQFAKMAPAPAPEQKK